jgi:hypothetical protein
VSVPGPIGIEQREHEYAVALRCLEDAAADWLDQRAEHGARVLRKYDQALDEAIDGARRTCRRLDETRKRVARTA